MAFLNPSITFVLVFTYFFVLTVQSSKIENVIMPLRVNMCKTSETVVANQSYKLEIVGKSLIAISVNATIPLAGLNLTSVTWKQYRCRTPNADEDSCEFLIFFPVKDPCQVLGLPRKPWSNFISTLRPELRCPIEKGNYHMDKYVLDSSRILKSFGSNFKGDYYWLMVGESRVTGNRLFHCVETLFQIITRRV